MTAANFEAQFEKTYRGVLWLLVIPVLQFGYITMKGFNINYELFKDGLLIAFTALFVYGWRAGWRRKLPRLGKKSKPRTKASTRGGRRVGTHSDNRRRNPGKSNRYNRGNFVSARAGSGRATRKGWIS